jgi:hypothetical protein
LARGYEIILSKYGVTGPVKSIFALAEYLSVTSAPSSFDVVHCQNALDHSFDPVRGIHEMLRIVTVGGAVILRHQNNEAENERYKGSHQFNFCEENGRFIVCNKSARYDIEADRPVEVSIVCETTSTATTVTITKNSEFKDIQPSHAAQASLVRDSVSALIEAKYELYGKSNQLEDSRKQLQAAIEMRDRLQEVAIVSFLSRLKRALRNATSLRRRESI